MTVTEYGITVPRFHEFEAVIQADQIANIPQKFTYQNNKLIHQINSIMARALDLNAQTFEAAWDTIRLATAEGKYLEELGRIRGVYRLPATKSNSNKVRVRMITSYSIPAGSVFYSEISGTEVYTTSDYQANTSSAALIQGLMGAIILVGATYTMTINGEDYSHVALITDTPELILDGIKAAIDADSSKTFSFTIDDTRFIITADEGTTVSASLSNNNMYLLFIENYLFMEASEEGAVEILAGSITKARTPITGLVSVAQEEDFNVGVYEETDAAFRIRIEDGPLFISTGTIPSIEQALLTNVPNVTLARVIENPNTAPTDSDGRPIHSFEVLVDGGFTNQDVFDEVWRTKPVGIETVGSVVGSVVDSGGVTRAVHFSRPTVVNIDIDVVYETYLEEPSLLDVETSIKESITNYLNSLPIGKDVIVGRLYDPVYTSTTGVGKMTITARVGADPFATTTIPIGPTQYARTTIGDVTVTPA